MTDDNVIVSTLQCDMHIIVRSVVTPLTMTRLCRFHAVYSRIPQWQSSVGVVYTARALIRQQRTALSLSLSRFLSFQLIIVVTVFVVFVSTTATSDVPHFMKFTSDEQLNGSDLRLSG